MIIYLLIFYKKINFALFMILNYIYNTKIVMINQITKFSIMKSYHQYIY